MPWVKPDYVAPRWLSGAQIQTIFAAKVCKKPSMKYRRERWETWDDDFIDVDWATPEAADPETPIIVNFHGLEGSSKSHYALALMHETVKRRCLEAAQGNSIAKLKPTTQATSIRCSGFWRR